MSTISLYAFCLFFYVCNYIYVFNFILYNNIRIRLYVCMYVGPCHCRFVDCSCDREQKRDHSVLIRC